MQHLDKSSDLNSIQSENGFTLSVNKPVGWTSFDVVNKVRYHLKFLWKKKKIKVGHAGTLDPLADGLLILGVGKGTKTMENWMGEEKVYSGQFKLGCVTPSFDAETEELDHKSTEGIELDRLVEVSKQFSGFIKQYPPVYSAVKKDGVKLYKMARRGEKVDLPVRVVNIESFEILEWNNPLVSFRVKCGKGTYIRSLASDFGEKLGTGAYLVSLKRESIGNCHINDAFEIEELLSALSLLKYPIESPSNHYN